MAILTNHPNMDLSEEEEQILKQVIKLLESKLQGMFFFRNLECILIIYFN